MIKLGELNRTPFQTNKWSEVGEHYFTVGEIARDNKRKLLKKMEDIRAEFEQSEFNFKINGDSKSDIGILTSGVGYCYAVDAVKRLDIKPNILKLGTTFPLPDKKIIDFMKSVKKLIVVEELSPYLEHTAKRLAMDTGLDIEIYGKDTGHFSEAMEYNVPIVVSGLAGALGINPPMDYDSVVRRADDLKSILPLRIPVFCAGCPHRATFWAMKQAFRGRDVVLNNDIGCYSMAFFPPLNMSVSMLSMGSTMSISAGMSQVLNDHVVSVIGDSTFFHAGLPGLVNAVYHDLNLTLMILDNEVTAMTGQQTHPGTPADHGSPDNKTRINIEEVCKSIGIKHLSVMDSYDVKNNIQIIRDALDFSGPAVVISQRSCALHGDRIKRRTEVPIIQNEVDKSICKKPHTCIRDFHCPAITFDESDLSSLIQTDVCDGCGVCARICPFGAIHPISSTNEDEAISNKEGKQ